MKLQQLRQFLAVAETLNFHRAAERLNISQPPLSMAIRRLEEDLGAKLFERTSQSVVLTEAGRAALEHARNAVFHADQVRGVVAQIATGSAGELRVHFVPSAMLSFLPSALTQFRVKYPKIMLQLTEADTSTVLAKVEAGDTDLGVVRYPIPRVPSITMVPIHSDPYVVALPEDHPLAGRATLRLSDLSNDPFIMPSERGNPSLYSSIMASCLQAGFNPTVVQRGQQPQTIFALVESGLGIALVPKLWERMAMRKIVVRPLSGPQTGGSGLGIIFRTSATTQAMRELIEVAQDVQKAVEQKH